MAPGRAQSGESTAARVSRQYRAAGPDWGVCGIPTNSACKILSISTTAPSPGGQASGMASHQNCRAVGSGEQVWHSAGLPQVLPHASPGAEPHDAHTGPVEGCLRAAARSGSARPTGCHTTLSVKIVGDHAELMIVRTLYGHKTHPDNRK